MFFEEYRKAKLVKKRALKLDRRLTSSEEIRLNRAERMILMFKLAIIFAVTISTALATPLLFSVLNYAR